MEYLTRIGNKIKRTFSPRHDRKVGFIICGVQKGGTTALDHYLRKHNQLCMAEKKEVHFFDNEKWFKGNSVNYQRYHEYFSPQAEHLILGEATPLYIYWDNALERIKDYNPNVKLILVVRNPIERAYSHWNMEFKRKREKLGFSEAIKKELAFARNNSSSKNRVSSYLARGNYTKQIEKLYELFPKENVLIIKNDDMKADLGGALDSVCNFLGVKNMVSQENKTIFSHSYDSPISMSDLEYLHEYYEDEIKRLEEMQGWNLSHWK